MLYQTRNGLQLIKTTPERN